MSIQQRQPIPRRYLREGIVRPWDPDTDGSLQLPSVEPNDVYMTVDERVGDTIGMVIAPWPSADEAGLSFEGRIVARWFDAAALQSLIDALRRVAGQIARPLRIGDAFWVRGFADSIYEWLDLRDVTAPARTQARRVTAAAAFGAIRPDDVFDSGALSSVDPDPTMPSAPMTALPTV